MPHQSSASIKQMEITSENTTGHSAEIDPGKQNPRKTRGTIPEENAERARMPESLL